MPRRCAWAGETDELVLGYHDLEWAVPSHDDRHLFEMLALEGAQAGLSWTTILHKRDGYLRAFVEFDLERVARFRARKTETLLTDTGIVRNRAKIESVVSNAKRALEVRVQFGSLDAYLWAFVGGRPVRNRWSSPAEIHTETGESREMSRDLKRRGFRFVGPTTCYAFMQAVGMVNDHEIECFRHRQV